MSVSLRTQLEITATAFRLGQEAKAASLLTECIEKLMSLQKNDALPAESLQFLVQALECQKRRDWIGLADTLEYDLGSLL